MIKPFGNRLLVRRKKAEAQTEGGIILPSEVTDKKFNEGTVVPPEGQESFEGNYAGTAVNKMAQREFDYQYNKKKAAEEAAAKKVSGTSGATKGM